MKKLLTLIPMLVILITACSKSKHVDSPMTGEYEFGFSYPNQISYGDMIFNSDGSVDGRRPDNGIVEKKIFTYQIENDSILTLTRSFEGDKTESIFVITNASPDTIYLMLKTKITRVGADAPSFMKRYVNEVTMVEYDSQNDSIPVFAFLKKK